MRANNPAVSPTSQLPVISCNRKRGRPKGSKDLVTDPKPIETTTRTQRRLGRPPGTGYKQKERAFLALSGESLDSGTERRPGRPQKNVALKVSIKFGPVCFSLNPFICKY
jgi:hypothetical protein